MFIHLIILKENNIRKSDSDFLVRYCELYHYINSIGFNTGVKMKKVIGLLIIGIISGCASNSKVDALANQVKAQEYAINELTKADAQEESQKINIYNRIASLEGKSNEQNIRLNVLANDIQSLGSKFDTKFRQNALK